MDKREWGERQIEAYGYKGIPELCLMCDEISMRHSKVSGLLCVIR